MHQPVSHAFHSLTCRICKWSLANWDSLEVMRWLIPRPATLKDSNIMELKAKIRRRLGNRKKSTQQMCWIARHNNFKQSYNFFSSLTLVANSRNEKPEDQHLNKKLSDGTSHKTFDYVDAITNLMVRNGEVAAAVACGDRHENGIISISSPNQTSFNEKAQVRPQYTSYV